MNPLAILSLISDLYAHNAALQQEVTALREQLAQAATVEPPKPERSSSPKG